jgi:hypothetical protein
LDHSRDYRAADCYGFYPKGTLDLFAEVLADMNQDELTISQL